MMAVNINYQQNTSSLGGWEAAVESIKESPSGARAPCGWRCDDGSRDASPRIGYFARIRAQPRVRSIIIHHPGAVSVSPHLSCVEKRGFFASFFALESFSGIHRKLHAESASALTQQGYRGAGRKVIDSAGYRE
jgi:hypothetical protein